MFGASKEDRKSDACDLYKKAANCFKLAEDKYQASDMYLKCAEMEENPAAKANHFKEAAGQFQGIDTQRYSELMIQAMEHYAAGSRISQAAGVAKDCASKFEEEYAYEEASKFYLKAHKFYDVDNTPTQSNSMLIKWADL